MGREYSVEDKKKFIKGHLGYYGQYFGKLTQEESNNLSKTFPKLDNYLIYGDAETLNKIGMWFILLKGTTTGSFKNRPETFDNLVQGRYADSYEVSSDYSNMKHPLLIVYVNRTTPNLSKNEPHMLPIFVNRQAEGLKTIILCELSNTLLEVKNLTYFKTVNLIKGGSVSIQNNPEINNSYNKDY